MSLSVYRRLAGLSLAGAVPALLLAALGWSLEPVSFAHSWLIAFLLWSGLGVGCLALLAVGHLLGEDWLAPVRSELEAGAATLPVAGLAAVPLLFVLADVYPWARPDTPLPAEADSALLTGEWLSPAFFAARTIGYLLLWGVLAWLLLRRGRRRRGASALALILLLPTVGLAGSDWVMSLDPGWWSGMYGIAFGLSQMTAALASAVLIATARPDREPPERVASMAAALLVLVAATAHLWFAQFLIVWSANLPEEAAWYLARSGGWFWLMPGIVVPAALAGTLLLARRRARRQRAVLVASAALLLVQHAAHFYWQVRPAAGGIGPSWTDAAAVAGLGLLCLALFAWVLPRRTGAAG